MKEYKGKSVFGGIAIGRIKVYNKSEQQVKRVHIDDTEHEKDLRRFSSRAAGVSPMVRT